MLWVKIEAGFAAIVTKNGAYRRVLTEGTHFVSLFEKYDLYQLNQPFTPTIPTYLLLRDAQLVALLEVVEVMDHELAIWLERGNFKQVLTPGQYAFWKAPGIHSFIRIDLSQTETPISFEPALLARPEIAKYLRAFVVESYERGLLFFDRQWVRELASGQYLFWMNTTHIQVLKADTRLVQLDVPGQEMLTKDKATIRVNFQLRYQVTDFRKALVENKEFEKQLYTAAQLALRAQLSTFSLDELLENKSELGKNLLQELAGVATGLGVTLIDCGIKDLILPGEMREIMNKVLVAQKTAEANVITRREETASTRSLLNTAKLMEENEMLFKLKEMEYVEKIAEKIQTLTLSGGNQVLDQLKQIFTK